MDKMVKFIQVWNKSGFNFQCPWHLLQYAIQGMIYKKKIMGL